MRLSACLIVANDEQHLDACLAPLAAFADEIVVVDMGSQDRSPDIAREHGAVVVQQPGNDPAAARNYAIDQAGGDWILHINVDELLQADPGDKACLNKLQAIAATVSLRASSQLTPYREYRLFRNRPDLRFRGVIDETVMPDLRTIREQEGGTIIHTPFRIEPSGTRGETGNASASRQPLLQAAVVEDPARTDLWQALGECELALGNAAAAEAAWRRALALVKGRASEPADAQVYAHLLVLHFGDSAIALADIDALVAEAGQFFPDDPRIMWYTARYLLSEGSAPLARMLLRRLLRLGPDGPEDAALAYDRRLFGEYAWALLGSCAMQEEAWEEAVTQFERVCEANPGDTEAKAQLVKASSQAHGGGPPDTA